MTRRSEESPAAGANEPGELRQYPDVTNEYVLEMCEALHACARTTLLNGRASYILAQELALLGKPFDDITLGEIAAAEYRLDDRYNALLRVLQSVKETRGEQVMQHPVPKDGTGS